MQVILLEKVQNLGELGETVKVKPGYARNFLLPGGKAVLATAANMAQFEERRAELERQQAEAVAAAKAQAGKLEGLRVVVTCKAGEEGKLFGSVGPIDVADAINAAGVDVERSQVRMHGEAIRQLGEYEVDVQFHADVAATITVAVEAEA